MLLVLCYYVKLLHGTKWQSSIWNKMCIYDINRQIYIFFWETLFEYKLIRLTHYTHHNTTPPTTRKLDLNTYTKPKHWTPRAHSARDFSRNKSRKKGEPGIEHWSPGLHAYARRRWPSEPRLSLYKQTDMLDVPSFYNSWKRVSMK
jgi:hypothetical protein